MPESRETPSTYQCGDECHCHFGWHYTPQATREILERERKEDLDRARLQRRAAGLPEPPTTEELRRRGREAGLDL